MKKYLDINIIAAVGLFLGIIYGGFVWYRDFGELSFYYWAWALGIMPCMILLNILMWTKTMDKNQCQN